MTARRPLPNEADLWRSIVIEPRPGLSDAIVADVVSRAAGTQQRRWWPAVLPGASQVADWRAPGRGVRSLLVALLALVLLSAGLAAGALLMPRVPHDGLLAITRSGELTLVDSRGRTVQSLRETRAIHPTWSADGSLLAFWNQDGNRYFVQVLDPSTGETRRLRSVSPTAMPLDEAWGVAGHSIQWAPDGRRLLLAVEAGWPTLYEADIATGSLRQLTPEGRMAGPGAWSADGRQLAYWDAAPFTQDWSLVVARADGSEPQAIFKPDDPVVEPLVFPTWTPDGKTILAALSESATDGATLIVRIDVATGVATEIARLQGAASIVPSPDGSRIAVLEDVDAGPDRLIVIDPDGSAAHAVAVDVCGGFAWSPDGAGLAFSALVQGGCVDVDTVLEVRTVAVDGSDVRTLWRDPPGAGARYGQADLGWQVIP